MTGPKNPPKKRVPSKVFLSCVNHGKTFGKKKQNAANFEKSQHHFQVKKKLDEGLKNESINQKFRTMGFFFTTTRRNPAERTEDQLHDRTSTKAWQHLSVLTQSPTRP